MLEVVVEISEPQLEDEEPRWRMQAEEVKNYEEFAEQAAQLYEVKEIVEIHQRPCYIHNRPNHPGSTLMDSYPQPSCHSATVVPIP